MYHFTDTTGASADTALPAEALRLNGVYLEQAIAGYRTLHVAGREALSPVLESYETGVRNGAKQKSRRYPARTITVTYQLVAPSDGAFRTAYNTLGRLLDVEDAELVFRDEPAVFFTGTPSAIGAVEPGTNAVTGEFSLFCADPLKYSLVEYESAPLPSGYTLLLDYRGTYPSYPTLAVEFHKESEVADDGTAQTLTGNGDCGFVAFYNTEAKTIQLGDADEVDGYDAYEKSQTLIHQIFENNPAFSGAASAPWTANAGAVLEGAVQTGSVGVGIASYATPASPAETAGTILDTVSDAGAPPFRYTVFARSSGRTASTVDLAFVLTAALGRETAYFGNGYGLTASVYAGGAWHDAVLKTTSEDWRGTSAHTVNLSCTVSGLSGTTTVLDGIKCRVSRSDDVGGSAGILAETACAAFAISPYTPTAPTAYYLTASSYGTAAGAYHGPSVTRTLPADQAGAVGAANFFCTYSQKLCMGDTDNASRQIGGFQLCLTDSDGNVVAGVRIIKHVYGGTTASLRLFVNNAEVDRTDIDLTYHNPYFGADATAIRTSSIVKSGRTITFKIGDYVKGFVSDALRTLTVTKITVLFETYADCTPLAYNGLCSLKFVKSNCDTWKDTPNKFSANDVVTADCRDGTIRLNGVPAPELGALGNDWEDFFLTPGINRIGSACSSWVPSDYVPRFRLRYREAFL